MEINIKNEYARLRRVVLGTPASFGGVPKLEEAYDPKSKQHIANGTFPTQDSISSEMKGFLDILLESGVEVIRPDAINDYNQIFSRDIAVAIDDKFIIANMIKDRSREIEAIKSTILKLSPQNIIDVPKDVRFEGGDIMPHNEFIFIGYSEKADFDTFKVARTNKSGVDFFKNTFPHKTIKAFELTKSDIDPMVNALHLDCCFQPLGLGHAIIHKPGFKNQADAEWLIDHFGKENCLEINSKQMFNMNANLFSINSDHVVTETNFHEVNSFLEAKGYKLSKINYSEIAKMEGLLRCSTLPLSRG